MSFANVPDTASHALLDGIKGENLNDEDLLRIHSLFGKQAFEALNLLEEGAVVRVTSPSGRFIYKVNQKGDSLYCSRSGHFCACMKGEPVQTSPFGRSWCPHLLAVALSDAISKTQTNTISDLAIAHAVEMLFKIF
nr:zinc finger SWIM domain containing protein [Hymenolepis microstoma]